MSESRERLQAAVADLEAVTAELQAGVDDHEAAVRLADRALELSAQISEYLPRVIRELEDAAQGR